MKKIMLLCITALSECNETEISVTNNFKSFNKEQWLLKVNYNGDILI